MSTLASFLDWAISWREPRGCYTSTLRALPASETTTARRVSNIEGTKDVDGLQWAVKKGQK